MNQAQAKKRIEKLKELINEYRYLYHVKNESIMSEEAADSLKHELANLENQYPDLITPDSPTQRVAGEVLKAFNSVEHDQRMLSLNDVFNVKEIEAWVERITKLLGKAPDTYFEDVKMDGLAMSLIYENGKLIQGLTRGDGYRGEDVTLNIKTIESIPLKLRESESTKKYLSGRTEVRGEIVMYKKDFEELNKKRESEGLPLFANPRNTAAGTIRQLDSKLVSERKLYFRSYDLFIENELVETNELVYKTLDELGFLINKMSKKVKSVKEIEHFIKTWEDKRHELPFNTDGLVIKVNDRNLFKELGIVGKAPRGAVAFKYAAEQATTIVKDIFVSIGRTGSATPVAILEPVVIAGSTVQMATLHNDQEIARKDIRIGDSVIVHKAGDIIPEIVEPLIKLRTGKEKIFKMPENCPDCNTPLKKEKVEDVVYRCVNEKCPSRMYKLIEHYASKSALDIEGLGEKNVIALINANLISDQADIYALRVSDLEELERFAEVSANKLVSAIKDKKNPSLAKFIYGLGIRHVGVQTAVDLSNYFTSLDKLSEATEEELENVEGVGSVVAESVVEWFAEPTNIKLLAKFSEYGVLIQEVKKTTGPLNNIKFAITGSLNTMGREIAAQLSRDKCGVFQSSVGKDTNFLVVGENVGESKLIKANKLGTKQISEEDLIKLLKG